MTYAKYWAVFLYILIVFMGVSVPYFSLIVIGIAWSVFNVNLRLIILLILALAIFLFQGFSLITYPFLAIFAALGTRYLIDYKISINGKYISYPKIFSHIFIWISVAILILSPKLF
ncbi:MAG: hypothetical protein WC894_04295 [Patescibacteria group bacterium]